MTDRISEIKLEAIRFLMRELERYLTTLNDDALMYAFHDFAVQMYRRINHHDQNDK